MDRLTALASTAQDFYVLCSDFAFLLRPFLKSPINMWLCIVNILWLLMLENLWRYIVNILWHWLFENFFCVRVSASNGWAWGLWWGGWWWRRSCSKQKQWTKWRGVGGGLSSSGSWWGFLFLSLNLWNQIPRSDTEIWYHSYASDAAGVSRHEEEEDEEEVSDYRYFSGEPRFVIAVVCVCVCVYVCVCVCVHIDMQ